MYKHCAVNQETNITPTEWDRTADQSWPIERGNYNQQNQSPSLPLYRNHPAPEGRQTGYTSQSLPSQAIQNSDPPPAAGSTKSRQRMVQTIGSGTDSIQSLACEAYLPKLVALNSAILDFGRSNLFFLTLIDNSTVPYLRSARLK